MLAQLLGLDISEFQALQVQKYYVRAKLRITQAPLSGSCYFGFVQEPERRLLEDSESQYKPMECSCYPNGATSVPGTSIAYNLNQWYDILLEYQFIGGDQVLKFTSMEY